jgi:hypothetical protein
MSFVTAGSETLAVCGMHGECGLRVDDSTISQKFCCELGATTDSAGVQDGLIRDVTNCRTGISRHENTR